MRFEIGFGIGFDRVGKPIDPVQAREALKLILAEAAMRFGGCFIVNGQGSWIGGDGSLIVEESRVLVVDGDESEEGKAMDLAQYVRRVLDQEAVHFAKVTVEAMNLTATFCIRPASMPEARQV